MLYNVYIDNGIAIKVTEYNSLCTPCNEQGAIKSQEKRIMNINLPIGYNHNALGHLDAIKKYINLNNLL